MALVWWIGFYSIFYTFFVCVFVFLMWFFFYGYLIIWLKMFLTESKFWNVVTKAKSSFDIHHVQWKGHGWMRVAAEAEKRFMFTFKLDAQNWLHTKYSYLLGQTAPATVLIPIILPLYFSNLSPYNDPTGSLMLGVSQITNFTFFLGRSQCKWQRSHI